MTDHLRPEISEAFDTVHATTAGAIGGTAGVTPGGTDTGTAAETVTADADPLGPVGETTGYLPDTPQTTKEGPIAYDLPKTCNPDVYFVETTKGLEDKTVSTVNNDNINNIDYSDTIGSKKSKKGRLMGAKKELNEEIEQFLQSKKEKVVQPINNRKRGLKHSTSMPDLKKIEKISQKGGNMFGSDLNFVRNIIYADIPLTKNSFALCPHPNHCAQNAVFKGLLRTFAAAYMFKTTIALAGQLFGGRIISFKKNRFSVNYSKIESIYYNIDTIKFAQFVGLASFTFKAVCCLLRRWRLKDSIYHKTIAGFLAGLWVLRDTKERRKTLALYCMVRMLGDWAKLIQYLRKNNGNNVSLSLKQLFERKTVKKSSKSVVTHVHSSSNQNLHKTAKKVVKTGQSSNRVDNTTHLPIEVSAVNYNVMSYFGNLLKQMDGEVIAFTAAQLVIMYGTFHAPFAVDKSYYKWIKNMGQFTERDLTVTMRSRVDKNAMYRLANEKWLPCHETWHAGTHSCLKHNSIDFCKCIVRAGRMYFIVHFLPMLLFTPKIVFNNPMTFIKLKSLNTLRSSVFLSFYVFNLRQTVCVLRNLFKSDNIWVSLVAGFMAGLSIIIEHSKRRMELCLYVLPRTLEILFRLIPNKSYYKYGYNLLRSKYLPVISFAMAISGWMTLIQVKNGTKCANGLNMTVLRVIFGTMN